MENFFKFYNKKQWNSFLQESEKHQTPFILINKKRVINNYIRLKNNFPFANIFYAIKANPANEILEQLKKLNSSFDIASKYQLDKVLKLGVTPDRISYGNTIKKSQDIKYFYDKGVRIFATDSFEDIENISKFAPGSKIFCRFLFYGGNASWTLSKKFGCESQMAIQILKKSKQLGLIPYGVSFHVGSQQHDIKSWFSALMQSKYIFDKLNKDNIKLQCINMGGGFPCQYSQNIKKIQEYSKEIKQYLKELFGNAIPAIFIQPGRSLVGDSGILVTSIIQCTRKHLNDDLKWCYIDAGKFNGLIQTLKQSIIYNILQKQQQKQKAQFIIAGPTCDSEDIIYEKNHVLLNKNSKQGDRLYFLSCGAYTSTYASVEFNGFPPIKTYII